MSWSTSISAVKRTTICSPGANNPLVPSNRFALPTPSRLPSQAALKLGLVEAVDDAITGDPTMPTNAPPIVDWMSSVSVRFTRSTVPMLRRTIS